VIPLLGDGAPGDPDEAVLLASIIKDPSALPAAAPYYNGDTEVRTYLEEGERLVEAFNDGPASLDLSTNRIGLIPKNTQLQHQMECEASTAGCGPPLWTGDPTTDVWLQDTRDWYAVHGSGNKLVANILMADGSVKQFVDVNGDRYLNPGFPIPEGLAESDYGAIGYRDSTIELHPKDMFNGVFLTPEYGKSAAFEAPGF
jgi:prepilin-type processing-associated H-X9-DG protein